MSSARNTVFSSLSNEELVELAQSGSSEALDELSSRFIYTKGAGVSVSYLEPDDFVQESMIGFLRAVNTYDFSKGVPFEAYAFRCMKNSINTVAGKYGKEIPADSDFIDASDSADDPLDRILAEEELLQVLEACRATLTPAEHTIIILRAGGLSYDEIAQKLYITPKAVDSALQRARKKLKAVCVD